MRETGKETQMKDTTMKDTTRATISRRELVTAAYIVPFAAVRGSAPNTAGCGGGGGAARDGSPWARSARGAGGPPRPFFFPEKRGAAKRAPGVPDAKA